MARALLCLLLMLLAAPARGQDSAARPNVLLIISDDQGYGDYGFLGHPVLETPHLDALAARSLVFPRGYVTSPLCRPSLASIATGLHPHQHGVLANDVDPQQRAASDVPVQNAFRSHPNLMRLLGEAGYLTHQSGKWWEGSHANGGFTHGMTHGDPARRGRHGDEGLRIGREGLAPITTFVAGAIEAAQPFFLWYAPFLPHTPHNPPEEFLREYAAPGRPANVARYYAMCAWFDQTCGELLAQLEERGVLEDTL
ncbi:MAG: sulfatase-like hydrolase/transferase, partial [Planctomycetota bacterium]|nr:sulfatase-like hydrolase/transferase [Planctomycetota bacterium]